jgi:hypothetical protein
MALKLKKTTSVTREHLQMELGVDYYLEFETQPYKATEIRARAPKEGEKAKEPPLLCDVLAYSEDAEGILTKEYTIIVNSVLKSILDEHYPEAAVIGERLIVTKLPKVNGKDYNRFNVSNFDLDDGEDAPVDDTPKPNKKRGK